MKAVSDMKLMKIIQRIKELLIFGTWPDEKEGVLFAVGNGTNKQNKSNAFAVTEDSIIVNGEELLSIDVAKLRDGAADATYEIGDSAGEYSLQDALIEQAGQMKPGEERLVYFYDNVPQWFTMGYGVAKLYSHEGYEREGSAFVCVELFSGIERFYTYLDKSDDYSRWYCSDVIKLRNGICFVKDERSINAGTYETNIGSAKMALVTIEGIQRDPYTLMIDLDYQRSHGTTSEYWMPDGNGFFGASVRNNILLLSFEDQAAAGTIASVKLFY